MIHSVIPLSRIKPKNNGGFRAEPLTHVLTEGFIRRGSSFFLDGQPGAGKTTLFFQSIASMAQFVARPILFNTTEQSLDAVAATFERLELDTAYIHVTASENLEEAIEFATVNNCAGLFVDSINRSNISTLRKGETVLSGVATALCNWAIKNNAVAGGIRQINIKGEAAGEVAISHLPDCCLHLEVSDTGERTLSTSKNRHGEAPFSVKMRMTKRGLVLNG